MQLTGRSGEHEIESFSDGQFSTGYKSDADRQMALANHSAATANYDALNSWANSSTAGTYAAKGVVPFGPDRQPEEAMGFVMSGMINSYGETGEVENDTRGLGYHFGKNGLFSQNVRGAKSNLTASFGYHPVVSSYQRRDRGAIGAVTSAVGQAKTGVTGMLGSNSNRRTVAGTDNPLRGNSNLGSLYEPGNN